MYNISKEKEIKMWKLKEHNKEKEQVLKKDGFHPFLARLLSQKEIGIEKIPDFLCTEYKNISHPYTLNDLEKATRLFVNHALNKDTVAVIGDYDADGIISSTMVYEVCRHLGLTCKVFLPSRIDHGYGLNEKTIQAFKEKVCTPPDLLIVTDCGTTNKKEIEELKNFGIKSIIIIDHHLPGKEEDISTNADALINWHFSKCAEMCACGEVYQFIRGIRLLTKKIDPIEYLSYAAIGTIADSSPIIGDNRIIVKNGLSTYSLSHVCASGLNALINAKINYSSTITQTDIAFRIAPMINAAGRIETPDIVFRLLTEYDMTIAKDLAEKVARLNDERKDLQSFIEQEAFKKAVCLKDKDGIIIYDKNWHVGVVGIIASRLVDEFRKPVLVIGYLNGVWKGSGRSINGVNIREVLDRCDYMFEKYGGHAMAVGVTLKEEYLEQASEIFHKACTEHMNGLDDNVNSTRTYDAILTMNAISEEMAQLLNDHLSPYCNKNNSEPIFRLKDVVITNAQLKEGKGWRLITFNIFKGQDYLPIAFKMFSPKFGEEIEGERVDVYFSFPQHWDNSKRFEQFDLTVVDIVKRS